MPLSAVVNLGTNGNVGVATITVSPSRNVEVGEFIVVTLTERDHAISSVADNSSQTGTANSYVQDKANEGGDPHIYIYSCQVTRKILSTDTITATFAASGGAKSMCVVALPDANETSQLDKTSTTAGSGASTFTSNATTTTAQADEYLVGVACASVSSVDPGTISADAPWTLQHSYKPAGSGYGGAHGSRVVSATGTYTFSGAWGATMSAFTDAAIATYKGTVVAGGTTVVATVASSTAAVVAPPKPRPTTPFTEVNVRM